jgi:hypothetical protein
MLKEEHDDLLELLAQMEIEMEEYRGLLSLLDMRNSTNMLADLDHSIRRKVEEKYGLYIDMREGSGADI